MNMTRPAMIATALICTLWAGGCKKAEPPAPEPQPPVVATPAQESGKNMDQATAPAQMPGLPDTRTTKTVLPESLRSRLSADEAGVRRWLLQNRSALVTTVNLRKVSLDTDPQDEFLAVVPFSPTQGVHYNWLLLIDGQGDHFVVARDWTRRGVDAKASVVAHGRGGRPVLIVEITHEGRTAVEVWRMQAAGNVSSLGSFGTAVGEKARFEAPRTIIVTREGGAEQRTELVTAQEDFVLSPSPR